MAPRLGTADPLVPEQISIGPGRLAEGTLVQTYVLARLFGRKLLTLEGTVLLTPARGVPAEDPVRISRPDPDRSVAVRGSRLELTARRLAETGEALARLDRA